MDGDFVVHGRSVLPESKDTDAIDASMTRFMRNFEIPNGALAVVSANGRLVYAKGFTNLLAYDRAQVEPYYATADTRFRIGSLSKVLTGLSAIQVFQQLQLHPVGLYARVGEVVDLTTTPYLLEDMGAVWPVDPRLQDIRIRDLLTHSAGWFSGVPTRDLSNRLVVDQGQVWPSFQWTDRADLSPQYDPTSSSSAAALADVSRATYPTTANHLLRLGNIPPLSWEPGAYYAYSNYGYWLAGQAIAGVTCRSYASVVRELLLRPLGMEETHVGDVERGMRQVGEVPYFAELWPWEAGALTNVVYQSADFDGSYSSPDLPPEYGPYAERQIRLCAASGGWVSSVSDLARLARELFGGAPTVLNGASIYAARQQAQATGLTGYVTLCGLGVDSSNGEYGKSGHMESTMAWLYNFGQRSVGASGATVIYLFNRNTSALENGGEGTLRTALTGPVPSAPGAVTVITDWGADDLFTS